MISGAVSLRSRRCFSPFPRGTCSLSVARWYLALGGGPPGFARRSTCAALLRIPLGASPAFGHGALTLCGAAFQPPGLAAAAPRRGPINPPAQAPGFGLFRFRSPLPAESLSLPSPPPTEMFHFGGSRSRRPPRPPGGPALPGPGYPIRTPPDQSALAAPRGLSQPAASFVAPWLQGIRHAPIIVARPPAGPMASAGRAATFARAAIGPAISLSQSPHLAAARLSKNHRGPRRPPRGGPGPEDRFGLRTGKDAIARRGPDRARTCDPALIKRVL